MKKIFENNDFSLLLTGRNYDFVGIIETKGNEPLTFFFDEEMAFGDDEDDDDCTVDEDKTVFKGVYRGLKEYENNDDVDEEQETAFALSATSYLRTRDDGSTGFMADCKERGWLLALVKAYCPDKLAEVEESIY